MLFLISYSVVRMFWVNGDMGWAVCLGHLPDVNVSLWVAFAGHAVSS